MSKLLYTLAAAFAFICFPGALHAEELKPAPDFTLNDMNGKPVTLSSYKGSVVFLDFWATWCPPCRKSIPAVEKLSESYKGKPVVVLGINVENDPETVKEFAASKGISYPVLNASGKTEKEYTVQGIPAFFIINHKGEIVKRYAGYFPGMENEWQKEIDNILKALPVKSPKTSEKKQTGKTKK